MNDDPCVGCGKGSFRDASRRLVALLVTEC